jgi:AcrR family transcriptional regulator
MEQATAEPEGLRDRKKRQTRAAIADAAMTLFARDGFDAVTVADVARAADVSEKTVFNYFPSKEDLVLVHGDERRAELIAAVRARPAGTPISAPFRAQTLAFVEQVEAGPVERIVAVPRLVAGSRALRERLLIGWEQEARELAPAIAEEAGLPADDLVAAVVARTLAWTHRQVFRAAFTRLIAGEDRRAVAADLRSDAERAYDLLDAGLAHYGVK